MTGEQCLEVGELAELGQQERGGEACARGPSGGRRGRARAERQGAHARGRCGSMRARRWCNGGVRSQAERQPQPWREREKGAMEMERGDFFKRKKKKWRGEWRAGPPQLTPN